MNTDEIVSKIRARIRIHESGDVRGKPVRLHVPQDHYGALMQTSHYNRITGMVFVDGVRIHPYGRS